MGTHHPARVPRVGMACPRGGGARSNYKVNYKVISSKALRAVFTLPATAQFKWCLLVLYHSKDGAGPSLKMPDASLSRRFVQAQLAVVQKDELPWQNTRSCDVVSCEAKIVQ